MKNLKIGNKVLAIILFLALLIVSSAVALVLWLYGFSSALVIAAWIILLIVSTLITKAKWKPGGDFGLRQILAILLFIVLVPLISYVLFGLDANYGPLPFYYETVNTGCPRIGGVEAPCFIYNIIHEPFWAPYANFFVGVLIIILVPLFISRAVWKSNSKIKSN